jgi:hypothetical protein
MIKLGGAKDSVRVETCDRKKWHMAKAICALGALLLTVMAVPQLHAQASTGTILGTVMDSSGAVVTGATVVVTNTGTAIKQNAVTDSQGRYSVPLLQIGNYEVEFAKPGFQKVIRTGITLTVGSQELVDVKLPVGRAMAQVEVQGQAAEVETTSSTLSSLVDDTQMRQLPLNGRDYTQLLTLAPGVQTGQVGALGFVGRGAAYSYAGSTPWGQTFLLDNTDITGWWDRGGGVSVLGTSLGVDGMAEFTTLTGAYSAQYGGNAAGMNAVTRSGMNDFHGSAYEFIRNSAVDARNYYDPLTGPPPFKRNQFGATLGGPIKKDKAFFFFNYEGLRQNLGATMIAQVPDAAGAAGFVDGVNANNGPIVNGVATVNTTMAPYLALLPTAPAPILTASGLDTGVGNLKQVASEISSENFFIGRVDYHFSSKDSMFGSFVSDRGSLLNPFVFSPILGYPDIEVSKDLYFTTEEQHVFSPHLINTAHASYVRVLLDMNDLSWNPLLDFYPNNHNPIETGNIFIVGLSPIGNTFGDPTYNVQNKIGLADNVIWNKGAHSVTAGFSVGWRKEMNLNSAGWAGSFLFLSFANFLDDNPFTFGGTLTGQLQLAQHWFWSDELVPYINDDWRVTRKLTLNLGLRYDFYSNIKCYNLSCYGIPNPLTATDNATLGFTEQADVLAQSPSKRNWEPRIGLAYDLFGNHKTSIRGGFAIFHNLMDVADVISGVSSNYPFSEATAYAGSPTPPTFPVAWEGGNGQFPPASEGTYQNYYTDDTPRVMEWNVNVQRELLKGSVLQVGYVGSHSVHQTILQDANPGTLTNSSGGAYTGGTPYFGVVNSAGQLIANPKLNPVFGGLLQQNNTGVSRYDSFQVSLNRQMGRDLQGQINYVLARCDDIVDGFGGAVQNGLPIQNPYDPAPDYGPCGFTSRQVLHFNTVYALPLHRNRAVEGWQFSAILSVNSGQPVSALVGWDSAALDNSYSYPSERANLNSGYSCGKGLTTGNPNSWFKTAAFSQPTLGTLGDSPRGCIIGPGLVEPDIALSKETKITERVGAQLRFEVFNFINHANFGQPGLESGAADSTWNELFTSPPPGPVTANAPGLLSPAAGEITVTSTTSRQMQLGLKITF